MPGLMRAAVAWGCVLSGLCLSIGATRAIAAPQQNASPASKPKANPAAKSAADSAEFKKLAARATEAREQDRLQEAAGLYEKALKLNPRWQEGWWYLGTLDYDANNYGDGVKAFRNLVGLNRENVPALALLGLCEFETHDYGNALFTFRWPSPGTKRSMTSYTTLSNSIWRYSTFFTAILRRRTHCFTIWSITMSSPRMLKWRLA